MAKIIHPLGWGDPACVREAFFNICHLSHNCNLDTGGYISNERSINLQNYIREIGEENLGIRHKYIIITNGAMQGIDAALSFFKNIPYEAYPGCGIPNVCDYVETRPFYFPHYPKIIKKNNLIHHRFPTETGQAHGQSVELNDNPSNPQAYMGDVSGMPEKVIWDAVYNNPIYKSMIIPPIHHNLAICSFGKLFGLSGLRLGWVGTNDKKIADYISNHVEITTCGVSAPSQIMMEEILNDSHIWRNIFYKRAKAAIDSNKTDFLKIKHLFDGQIPGDDGMFFFPRIDPKALKILSKAGIQYTPGSACGDRSEKHIRLNMAQRNKITNEAIKAILKADKS